MKIAYYPIRGRGEDGLKFQLARIQDESGNLYKGRYDQERHFSSEEEIREHLVDVLNLGEVDIQLELMSL